MNRVSAMTCCMVVSMAAAVCVSSAIANGIAWDSFDYNVGGLAGNGGAADGWNGGWSGANVNVVSPGLAFPGLAISGNAVQADGQSVTRVIDTSAGSLAAQAGLVSGGSIGVAGQSLWISMLGQGTDGGLWGGIALVDGSSDKLFIGKPYTDPNWGFDLFGGPGGRYLSDSPITEKVLFVARVDFQATDGHLFTGWVLPASGYPGGPPADLSGVTPFVENQIRTETGLWQFDTIRIYGDPNEDILIDELRLGSSYSSVMPEPTSMALFNLGLLGLLGLRRCRK